MYVRLLSYLVQSLLATMLLALLVGAGGLLDLHAHGGRLLSIQTASMRPTFRPGDALAVMPTTVSQLKLGQIISYQSPRDPRVIISHRLTATNHQTGQLTTAGDALRTPDPSFPPSQLVGQATIVAPGLGRLIDTLHKPLGLALAVYLPAAALIAYELHHLSRRLSKPTYKLLGRRPSI